LQLVLPRLILGGVPGADRTRAHDVRVVGYRDDYGLDRVRLHCGCGWKSAGFDSGYATIEALNGAAVDHLWSFVDWDFR